MANAFRTKRALIVLGLVGLVGALSSTTASAFHFGGGGGGAHFSAPHFGGGGGFHPAPFHFNGGGGFHPSVSHFGGGRRSFAHVGGSRPSYSHFGGNHGSYAHLGHGIGGHSHGHDGGFSHQAGHHPKGGDRWPRGPRFSKIGSHCGHWNHWCGGGGGYTPVVDSPVYDGGDVTPVAPVTPVYSGDGGPSYRGPSYSAPVTKAPTDVAPPKTCTSAGTFVTVVFQPNVTSAAITAFLKDYDVTMADGPNADGMYRIRISQETAAPDQFGQMIESMRSKKDVISSIEI